MGKRKNKNKQVRAAFRKNRTNKTRKTDWTSEFDKHKFVDAAPDQSERVSGKGELTRGLHVKAEVSDSDEPGFGITIAVDHEACKPGRVLAVRGLHSDVESQDEEDKGTIYRCATRRLLKTLATDQRHVVAAGDYVLFRLVDYSTQSGIYAGEGIIERVEPRKGSVTRTFRGRQHIIVTNAEQLLIITSAAQPRLKPNLIDRMILTAEKVGIAPIVCINKSDLIDPAELQPLLGVYGRMGYEVLLTSADTGFGLDRLRELLRDKESVLAGQSGVGKSSLLNAIAPDLELRTRTVSDDTGKGRHTTTTAVLLPLPFGGYVVDTPGIRQFELWDVIPEEVSGFFRDVRPYVSFCKFPDCTHTHEAECAVKGAVADGKIDARRYESYCQIRGE